MADPIEPKDSPLYQARAEEADRIVRGAVADMALRWTMEDASASADGETVVVEMVVHPILAGATRGLTQLAWDWSHAHLTAEDVAAAFRRAAFDGLEELAEVGPAGSGFRGECILPGMSS